MARPEISVIMSAYNASEYIRQAIDSILNQTYKNFELIIINDGSNDDTLKIIKSYHDSRIVIVDQKNIGLVASLNKGIALSKSGIIARHDADDASEPTRFEKQFNILKNSSKIAIVGSSISVMDMDGKILHKHHLLLSNSELKQELLVRSPFAHGSVMYRKVAFYDAGGYKKEEWPAEDYGLWIRLSKYGNFQNIDEPLYIYRENTQGISSTNFNNQQNMVRTLQRKAWKKRHSLTPKCINTYKYISLDKGEDRIERIAANLLVCIKKSFLGFDLKTLFKYLRIIGSDYQLIKKSARILIRKILHA